MSIDPYLSHGFDSRLYRKIKYNMEKYTIKKFAALVGVTIRTLHHYDQIKLLTPPRNKSKYREYKEADIKTMKHIEILQLAGISLNDAGMFLKKKDFNIKDYVLQLEEKITTLQKVVNEIK